MNKKTLYTVKPLLISLLIGLSITACNSGTNTTFPSNAPQVGKQIKTVNSTKGITLGAPTFRNINGEYDVISNSSYIPYESGAPVRTTNSVFETQFKKDMTSEEILKTLGITGSLKGGYKDLSGDFTARYLYEVKNSSNELRLTYYSYYYKFVSFANPSKYGLTDSAKDLPVSEVGSGFVTGANAGIFVEATVHIKFENSTDKNDILAHGGLDYSNLVKLSGSFDKLDDKTKKKINIEVELIQRGGDSEHIMTSLKDIVIQNGGTIDISKPFFLSSIGLDNAYKLFDAIQYYISTDFNEQVHNYIESGANVKIKNLEDLNKLYMVANGLAMQPYNNSTAQYMQDIDLVKITEDHNKEYSQLLSLLGQFNKYLDLMNPWVQTVSTPPAALVEAENIKDELNIISTSFVVDANSCYPSVIESSSISKCKIELQKDILAANTLREKLDKLGWQQGYKLRASSIDTKDTEYLIPIGVDNKRIQYFVTYTLYPSISTFSSGAVYALNKANKISMEFIPEPMSESSAAGRVAFTGDAAKSGLGLSFSNIIYTDQNGTVIPTPSKPLVKTAPQVKIIYQ